MTGLDEIADLLGVYRVHEGFPVERRKLAGDLLASSLTIQDIEMLGDHVAQTADGNRGAILAAILQDPDKREQRLQDLRRCAQLRRERARPFGDAPARIGPLPEEDPAEWARDRQARIAWCRVGADRRPRAEVAAELGVSLRDLDRMVERGRALNVARLEAPRKRTREEVRLSETPEQVRARVREWRKKILQARVDKPNARR
jgi:hypothetical protein